MSIPRYDIICTRKELIAKDTFELRFTRPPEWTFKAGQFVLLDVPLLSDPSDIQTRAYSIATKPGDPDLLFAVKLKAGGRSSTWVEQTLREGVHATMQGPFGNFVVPQVSHKPYLFLATGAGIAPFRAQIQELLERDEVHPIDLIFGVRDESEIFWRPLFETLAHTHARFSFHLTLTRPGDTWTGHRGRVQTLVPFVAPNIAERIVFACGNPEMTKEVKTLALGPWGVSKQDVHVEGFL